MLVTARSNPAYTSDTLHALRFGEVSACSLAVAPNHLHAGGGFTESGGGRRRIGRARLAWSWCAVAWLRLPSLQPVVLAAEGALAALDLRVASLEAEIKVEPRFVLLADAVRGCRLASVGRTGSLSAVKCSDWSWSSCLRLALLC